MIVAGNFTDKAQADSAIAALTSGGITPDHISSSFVLVSPDWNVPDGGNEAALEREEEVSGGALKGAAIGGVIGLGAGVIAGPAGMAGGAAVGAYVGSLAGAFAGMTEEVAEDSTLDERCTGVTVAVDAPVADRAYVAQVLRNGGASDIRENERTWRDGKWVEPNAPA